jgi:hypothetical protein
MRRRSSVGYLPDQRRFAETAKSPHEHQILGRCQVGVEMWLLWNVSDAALVPDGIVRHEPPVEPQRAGAWVDEADDRVDGRALARTVRAQITQDLATTYLEIDAVEREKCTVSLCQSTCFQHGFTKSEMRRQKSEVSTGIRAASSS